MLIRCIAHAKFLIETESGFRIVTDPYDASCGFPVKPMKADAVLVSHHHHDHDAVDTVEGWQTVVDRPGEHTLAPDVKVRAVSAFHDDENGAKRGSTLLFSIRAEGLNVVHLGDLGHLPSAEQIDALGPVDVLLIPVGGFFTIDALTAREVCGMLKARVVIPMHYRAEQIPNWPIAPLDDFLSLFPGEPERLSLLRVTAEDLSLQPRLAVLTPQA